MTKNGILTVAAALALSCSAAFAQTETVTYTYSGNPIWIFPDEADVVTIAQITVPRALRITKVTATVNVEYDGVGDLNVYMYSPINTRSRLLERNCGTLRNINTTFDDTASSKFADTCPVEAGRGPFQANEPLGNFNDQSSFGVWWLAVENNGSNKTGWLTSFSITITGTRSIGPTFNSSTVTSANGIHYRGGVAPGQLVSIVGVNMGPSPAVTAPSGSLPTTLGGMTVSMNGVPIPIALASLYRLDVVIPYNVTPGSTGTLRVSSASMSSSDVTVNIYDTRPGVYAATAEGSGQVKAVNSDGTLNNRVNAAARGTVLSVYATGLGSVAPGFTAGSQAPNTPLYNTSQPVAASIGGVPCMVLYAGLAPGTVGVYQVNVMVEGTVPIGTRDLVLSVGGNPTQSAATVEIR